MKGGKKFQWTIVPTSQVAEKKTPLDIKLDDWLTL